MIISGIKNLIISGGDVIAQAVIGGAAVLNLELAAGGGDRKDHLVTKLQAAVATVLVGYVPGAVHVRTGDAFTQGEAVEDNFRCGIFFFHTSLPFPYAPKYSLAVQP